MRGKPQYRLSDLPQLPEPVLAKIMPAIREDVDVDMTADTVRVTLPGRPEPIDVYSVTTDDPWTGYVFQRFDGRTSIGEIASMLSGEVSCSLEQSFDCVRTHFLRWVGLGICVPANPVE